MIESERLAWLTGMTVGGLMSSGINVRPDVDEAGDYKNSFVMELPYPATPGTLVRLTVSLLE